jgi:hypothetical protein
VAVQAPSAPTPSQGAFVEISGSLARGMMNSSLDFVKGTSLPSKLKYRRMIICLFKISALFWKGKVLSASCTSQS